MLGPKILILDNENIITFALKIPIENVASFHRKYNFKVIESVLAENNVIMNKSPKIKLYQM